MLTVMFTVVQCHLCGLYLLYHDAVDAHVFVASGEVEHVHPAESKTQHQQAEVLPPPEQVQPGGGQEQGALHKTTKSREATVILHSYMLKIQMCTIKYEDFTI